MSIDDPLFEAVGSDRIRMILQQMGMDANETIEHSLISASIGRAQAKFCKIVHTERISDNETQWYAWNIGDKYQGA
jgi:preprotein translocase subunit SecA